jgi:chromosomal replication initiator protein
MREMHSSVQVVFLSTLWENVLCELKKQITPEEIEHYFSHLVYDSENEHKLTIKVQDHSLIGWLQENYYESIEKILAGFGKEPSFFLEFIADNDVEPRKQNRITPAKTTSPNVNFFRNYTFDNFVVGKNNQFAHAAAQSVAENPSHSYNPLYIYGPSGLGKTHLLHAIGAKILATRPNTNICLTTCEEFTNQFIYSLQHKKGQSFRERFRNVDVLLIDDIQFLSGKTGTQEEFFHTFNSLHAQDCLIVLTSDSEPSQLEELEDRIISRFQWGLIADISPPALETRIAIIKKKAAQLGVLLPDDVVYFIAGKIKSNIREIEGALNQVHVYASINKRPIDLEITKKCLRRMIPEETVYISCERIQNSVAERFRITRKDLLSKNRSKNISHPRQIAMYLTRQLTGMSLPEIGQAFGNKHHSTVMHSIQKIEKSLEANMETQSLINSFHMILK